MCFQLSSISRRRRRRKTPWRCKSCTHLNAIIDFLQVESSCLVSFPFTELPGFYFDPEKNRYFRLLPGHNNCNPLTKEVLEKKEQERKRTELLAEDERQRKVSAGVFYCTLR